MSVINKMLQDLDRRQTARAAALQKQAARTGLVSGTRIANTAEGGARLHLGWLWGALSGVSVVVVGATAGAWWYLNQAPSSQVRVTPLPVSVAPVIAAAPAALPVVTAPLPESPASAPLSIKPMAPPLEEVARVVDPLLTAAVTTKTGNTANPVPAPVMKAPAVSVPALVAPDPVQNPPRRSSALEALAQAQSLWQAGSTEAGINLLRDAVAVMERASLRGTPPVNSAVLASMARELARMELAEGQVSEALAMLTQLEPQLAGFADVWAIRGNAAQRLGRYPESTAAYLRALKLRPDEARWMLGAAVSLAAQGQTAAAAELAEKARLGGALSPEVAQYLRQLGVLLRPN